MPIVGENTHLLTQNWRGSPNHPLTYPQHECSCPLCLRNALWRGPWLTQKLAMWLSCRESRRRLAAWRSSSARSGARHSARVRSTNVCWTSRPAWSRRLRPTAACSVEMRGEQKPLRCSRWPCVTKEGKGRERVTDTAPPEDTEAAPWGLPGGFSRLGSCIEKCSFFLPTVDVTIETSYPGMWY